MIEPIDVVLARLREEREADSKAPKLAPQYITTPGHEIRVEGLSIRTKIRRIADLAIRAGFEVKAGGSAFVSAERNYKNEVKPGVITQHTWLQGQRVATGDRFTFSVTGPQCIVNGQAVSEEKLRELF